MAGRKKFWWTTAGIFAILVACGQIVKDDDENPEAATVVQAAAVQRPLPNLAGKTLVEAENAATELGLEFESGGLNEYGHCYEETDCFVYRMVPKAGTRLRIGQKIKLTIGVNYGSYTTGGGGNYDVDVNVGGNRRGGGICSRSRWC